MKFCNHLCKHCWQKIVKKGSFDQKIILPLLFNRVFIFC
jgi:hypothetical protein